jgi:flagellum-specific ATP synthase
MEFLNSYDNIIKKLDETPIYKVEGKINSIKGLLIEAIGVRAVMGEVCIITSETGQNFEAEVIGFNKDVMYLMTYNELTHVGPNSKIVATGHSLRFKISDDLRGQVLDGAGRPMTEIEINGESVPINNQPPNPLTRPLIGEVMETGIKAIDSFLTVGKGQRMGIFAGSGVGKSSLISNIIKNCHADVNVVALVGERGREVAEFINNNLGVEGLKKSIIVCSTSDQSPVMRLKAPFVATTIAEYYRDQGMDVNLYMDSVTRFAMAQREIGLSLGEPPTTKGYPPSLFSMLPRLLERTGTSSLGTITAFYTVLVEGDDLNDPIVDTVRGIIDGHIVLSRRLAERNHYPAIDISASISRLYDTLSNDYHKSLVNKFVRLYSTYRESEDLITIGAYQPGNNIVLDEAVQKFTQMEEFLVQESSTSFDLEDTLRMLEQVLS